MAYNEPLGPWILSSFNPQPSPEAQTRGWCLWVLHHEGAQKGAWGTYPIGCLGVVP